MQTTKLTKIDHFYDLSAGDKHWLIRITEDGKLYIQTDDLLQINPVSDRVISVTYRQDG